MKLILGILCLIAAIPLGYFITPKHKEKQLGDLSIKIDAISVTIGLIVLGIILIISSSSAP
jgi:hypothetical protein